MTESRYDMQNLNHIINPVELVELVIFRNLEFNIEKFEIDEEEQKEKPKHIGGDLMDTMVYEGFKSFFAFRINQPMEIVIATELEAKAMDEKTFRQFDSDTRLKLLLINNLFERDPELIITSLVALGWNEDWQELILTALVEANNPDNIQETFYTLRGWFKFYEIILQMGSELNLVTIYDYIPIETIESQIEQIMQDVFRAFKRSRGNWG